ncbi:MAG: signal peptide peptidase SppA [Ignavibacteriales bacterium]|nr:signal peptide peptidase SppA [Ignavibacteriales bacterium]
MLGVFLSFIFVFVIFVIFMTVLIAGLQTTKVEEIPQNSVLEIKLNYFIPERSFQSPLAVSSFPFISLRKQIGLNEIIDNIRKAKTDFKVKGIYINLNNFTGGGIAVIEPIRRELLDFKKSKKFIIAFGDNISQRAYYLASAADKIYMTPEGSLDFRGLSVEMMFFKNTLDKLEIEPQIFQAGEYKSATESFKSDKMSEPNRRQITELLNSINEHFLKELETTRKIPYDSLKLISSNFLVRTPEDARKYKLIDELIYKDQVFDEMKKKARTDRNKKLSTVSIEDYTNVNVDGGTSNYNRIAVIYAVGEIANVSGNESIIGTENITDAIKKARDDERVKAIVMRVASPGGDALTSDIIWREVALAKKKKPFIVSMSGVAASGGYYISCAADSIVAEPNTITGSIGVFGIIPNMKNFFKNKLGISFDRVNTGKFSDYFNVNRPLTVEEKKIVQSEVDRIYKSFVSKVSVGRRKSFEEIQKIAQGRVWTGLQAKENGLVDEIGGLKDAIRIAAAKARVKQYSIVEYPTLRSIMKTLLEDFSADAELSFLKLKLGDNFRAFDQLKQVGNLKGVQARLPVELDIN